MPPYQIGRRDTFLSARSSGVFSFVSDFYHHLLLIGFATSVFLFLKTKFDSYDLHLLCILTSFWVLCAPKSWSKHFWGQFSTIFDNFKHFSVIFHQKSRKNVKNGKNFLKIITEKNLKINNKVENGPKKCFDQLSNAHSAVSK